MNVKEFYAVVEGNYDEAMGRLLTEKRIVKYLRKLPETGDVAGMNAAFAAGNWEDAFRFSHNVKGVSLNLSLTSLAESAAELCDTVRHGAPQVDFKGMLAKVNEKYELVLKNIEMLEDA
ncbi:MAG: hypothetical protein CW338_02650 [Clostridiales bacterium]|nr:hypothetical protein [Clostridiales bacterium]